MRRIRLAVTIVTLLLFAGLPLAAQSIFVSNDEWITTATGLPQYDDAQLVTNFSAWLTSQTTGRNILILANNTGLRNTNLKNYLMSLGYTVTETTSASVSLSPYQAVFLSGDCTINMLTLPSTPCPAGYAALDAALIKYVNGGGNVFLEAGLTCNDDVAWNGFLSAFGLALVHGCNGILASQVDVSAFQAQSPYGAGLFTNVNSVYIDNGENVRDLGTHCGVQMFYDANGNGLYAAWRPCCQHPNILVNGSFEMMNFNAWVEGGNFQFSQVVTGPNYSYSGAEDLLYYALLGPVGADGTLSQTAVTTPGAVYSLCFWVNSVGDNPSDFTASWNGTELLALSNPNSNGVWTQYQFLETGTGADTITFGFRDDPGYIALDNVVISPQ